MKHPIDGIQWIDVDQLNANDYNPNVVIGPEFRLLKLSMLKQGWIQPVLVVPHPDQPDQYTIIDGFHRCTLTKTDTEIQEAFGTKVPCAVMDIDEAERKMLTVRINRAKGTHVSARMHDLVTSLVEDHDIPIEQLMKELGADRAEIELLLQESVFTKMKIDEHKYSRAWGPKDRGPKIPDTAS